MKKICKECQEALPQGKSMKHHTCRVLGLCEYCYDMKFPESAVGGIDDDRFEAEIKEPSDSPWEWNESIRKMYDEIDHYER
jgi:hypothetical protein